MSLDWLIGCWVWPLSRGSHGYPQATSPGTGRSTTAHRLMFITTFGWTPEEVHHVCENGKGGCVNPFHLEGLTRREHGRRTAGILADDRCGRCGESNWGNRSKRSTRYCRTCKNAWQRRARAKAEF